MNRATIVLCVLLALVPGSRSAAADELTPQERQEMETKANDLNMKAVQHYRDGAFAEATDLLRQALDLRRKLYPKEKYPDGHVELIATVNNLGAVLAEQGEYARAEPFYRETFETIQKLYPKEKYPDGHRNLATSFNNMGFFLDTQGEHIKAEPYYRQALEMRRKLFPKEKYPDGHDELANSLINMGFLLHEQGEFARAEAHYREALEMRRKLFPKEKFPDGHPTLATTLSSLGSILSAQGDYDRAEPCLREALAMAEKLFPVEKYPNGHLYLASCLNNLGSLLDMPGKYDEAADFCRKALESRRKLYPKAVFPDGHPDLAVSLNNLALIVDNQGKHAEAEALCREALAMTEKLYPKAKYPDGHFDVARGLNNLGLQLEGSAEYAKSGPLLRDCLAMYQRLALRYAAVAAEAEASNMIAPLPVMRDAYLSHLRHVPASPADYDLLWPSKAALTRVLERRHRDLIASGDDEARRLGSQLLEARQGLAHALFHPGGDAAGQRKKVERLTLDKEDLEKRLARRLKLAAPGPDVDPGSPARLRAALPDGAALVDVFRHMDFEWDPKNPGWKGVTISHRYTAFVVRKDGDPVRVDLKAAAPIERAWADWHKAITAGRPDEKAERAAAAALARLVWEPLRDHLPPGLRTVYLATEGPLHQVPWGALPGRKPDTVVLDEAAVCLVDGGPWLLERLEQRAPAPAGDRLVAYGGIDYDAGTTASQNGDVRAPLLSAKQRLRWGALPATAREQRVIVGLARGALKDKPVERNGSQASTAQLLEDLPKARYAHLATHGFFADPQFRTALQVDPALFARDRGIDRRGGRRSPLVLSGLVLSGANRQGEAAPADRGILTGEALVGLPLEGLELAVLSACETGLGDDGGGEGVYGLQRAFHIAGCKNVVASLWKVDDGATQALMALFYRNLWEKKLDAAEALRQAQLTLYRHPEAVQVAQKRGLDFSESDLPKVEEKPAEKPQRSPTAHWAAFTFSGVRPAEKGERK